MRERSDAPSVRLGSTADGGDDQTINDLFGLAPGEFTAARDRAMRTARAEGRREAAAALAALRRPTQAAWAVNQLARHHGDRLTELLEIGSRMRAAQARPDPAVLRELIETRRRLVNELLGTAVREAADAGERLGDAAVQGVEQSLAAAIADPDAAEHVATGQLSAALTVPTALPDLGPLLAAVSGPPTPAPRAATAHSRQHRADSRGSGQKPKANGGRDQQPELQQALVELEQRQDGLRDQAAAARRAVREAEQVLGGAQQEAERTEADLVDAQAVLERARFAARRAEDARRAAADRLEELRVQAAGTQAAAEQAGEELAVRQREQP